MKKRDVALAAAGGIAAAVAVKMLTRPSAISWESASDQLPHADRSRFVNVDGERVHYQEFGDATEPPIILIHGFTASSYVWNTTAPMLASHGYRVIAVDLLGFGYSAKPVAFRYTIGAQARMISRLMDTLGIGRAMIVGSSYGGGVAATLALDYPARVDKLVLVSAVINDEVKNHPILQLASIPVIGEVITPFLIDSKIFLRRRMHRTLAPENSSLITKERVRNVQRPISNAEGHRAVLATSRNWSAERIERDAHLIRQPALLIWGERDRVIPLRNAYKLYDSILHSRLVILKNCGHVPQEEKSELFTELVIEFADDRKGRVGSREGASLTG